MMDHVGQDVSGVFMVSSKLRAAVVVRESNHLLDRRVIREFLFEQFLYVLSHTVYAADCRDNPKLIADTCASVLSSVSLEISLLSSRSYFSQFRLVCVFQKSFEIGLQVCMINHFTLLYRRKKMADRETILDYIGAC